MVVKRKKEAETLENKGFPLDYLLNWGQYDYESVALPAELHQHGILAGIDDTTLSAQRQHQFAARPSDCRHGMRSIPVYYTLYICTISCNFQPDSFA